MIRVLKVRDFSSGQWKIPCSDWTMTVEDAKEFLGHQVSASPSSFDLMHAGRTLLPCELLHNFSSSLYLMRNNMQSKSNSPILSQTNVSSWFKRLIVLLGGHVTLYSILRNAT